ncbi:hypothetical protein [Geobacter sp.]|uniref:hypothetical protein n=1 Tax=Geobacter sp. TaxID=46610 RepID=UPI0027B98FFE|nr:hypothetical protein [Geobacter sp.]
MKLIIMLLTCLSLLLPGCTCVKSSLSGNTPVDELVVIYKRALVTATEKSLLEEFVKYKEIGSTFTLYKISEINIEATASISKSSSEKVEASINFPLDGGLGLSKNIEIANQEGAKIFLKLEPLANTPVIYNEIKNIFDNTKGQNELYGIAYYNDEYKAFSENDEKKCRDALYCIPINCLKDSNNNKAFAYINNYGKFRNLIDRIRKIDPTPNNTKQ